MFVGRCPAQAFLYSRIAGRRQAQLPKWLVLKDLLSPPKPRYLDILYSVSPIAAKRRHVDNLHSRTGGVAKPRYLDNLYSRMCCSCQPQVIT